MVLVISAFSYLDISHKAQSFFIFFLVVSITLWTIWIEMNSSAFNQEQWHGMKVRFFTWDEYIMYMTKGASMVKYTTPLPCILRFQ